MPNLQIPMPVKTLAAVASVLIVSLPVVEQLPVPRIIQSGVVQAPPVVVSAPRVVAVYSLLVETPRTPQIIVASAAASAPTVSMPGSVKVFALPLDIQPLSLQVIKSSAAVPFVAPPSGALARTTVYALSFKEPPLPLQAVQALVVQDNSGYVGYVQVYSLPDEVSRPPQGAIFAKPQRIIPATPVPVQGAVAIYKAPSGPSLPLRGINLPLPVAPPPVVVPGAPPVVNTYRLPRHDFFKRTGEYDYFPVKRIEPPPGLLETVRTFTVPTGPSDTIIAVPHGLSVLPQIVIVTLSGRVETTDAAGRQGYRKSFGVAIAPVAQPIVQMAVGTHSDDATTFTQADDSVRNDCVALVMATGDQSPDFTFGQLAVFSIDDTNVTFIVNDQFDAAYTAQVEFIGGTDLTNLSLVAQKAPSVAGLQSITAPGFKPDFVMFFGGHLSSLPPAVENDSTTFIGAVDRNLNQWTTSGGVNDAGGGGGGGSGRARTYGRSGECIGIPSSAVNSMDSRAAMQSLDASGYTLNWTKITTVGRVFIALCVKGGNWAVGNFLSQTDTAAHQVVSGLSFKPIGAVLSSVGKAESVLDTLDINESWSVGLLQGSDPTVNMCQYVGEKDLSSGSTTVYAAVGFSSSYIDLDIAGALIAKASVVSIQPNGFTWQHSVADVSQKFIGYITFAPVPVPTFSVRKVTVKPKGGGDYLNLQTALQTELINHRNLITENIILEFDCYDGLDNIPVTVPGQHNSGGVGYMTDNAHFLYVKGVVGHVGVPNFDGSVYCLDITSDGNAILIQNEYIRFEQILLRHTVAVGGGIAAYFIGTTGMTAPTYIEFINCIAYGVLASGAIADGFKAPGAAFDQLGVRVNYINCVAFHYLSRDQVMSGFNTGLAANQMIRYYNCTAYDCNQGFQDHADVVHINCVAVGCDNGWNTSTGPNVESDYNFSTCGPPGKAGAYFPGTHQTGALDARGPHSDNGSAILMVDPLNDDIRPDGGDTSIVGTGKDLSFDGARSFSFDIARNLRTAPWSRGAYQPNLSTVQRVVWAWVGGITQTKARVAVKLNLPSGAVFLQVASNSGMAGAVVYGPLATSSGNVVIFDIVPLPGANYYQVMI